MGLSKDLIRNLGRYQSNLGWHSEEEVVRVVNKLLEMAPHTIEYQKLKANLFRNIALNGLEQFARTKYDAGMNTWDLCKSLDEVLNEKEEKEGVINENMDFGYF